MQNLIGHTLGQYEIEAQIGQGSMATVYRAHQRGLARSVALKVLHPHYAIEPESRERFLQEAQAIANLEHPHILPVYDFGEQDTHLYLVMRYIDPPLTLANVMHEPFAFEQALKYLDQIAAALDYAHGRGVIHRDVKPANILLKDNWIFLSDFGLVRLMEGATQLSSTHVGTGTPAYMSPEQGVGGKIDPRTDVYAVGVIAYQMLSGHIPHLADTGQAVIYRRNHEPPPSLRETRPEVPDSLDQTVQKALATRPGDRFQTTGAFVAALRRATQESNTADLMETRVSLPATQPKPERPPAPEPTVVAQEAVEPPAPSQNRNVLWLGLGLSGLVLLLILFTVIWLIATGGGPDQPDPAAGSGTPTPAVGEPTVAVGERLLFDHFDSVGLDQERWRLLSRGGEVQISGSELRLNSVGQSFPLVHPRRNPFPAAGNFGLRLNLRYLDGADRGSGVWLGAPRADLYNASPDQADFSDRRIVEIRQDSDDWQIVFGREESPVYRLAGPELGSHDIDINYIENHYQIMVDGEEVYLSEATTVRPTFFWIGSPRQAEAGSQWSGLAIDLIGVEQLPDDLTVGATPTTGPTAIAETTATAPPAAPTVTPPPTNTPTATPPPLGQNCDSRPAGRFGNVWEKYRDRLGCPTGGATTIPLIAEELFQGGHTFWRSDTDEVYIVYDRNKASGAELAEGEWLPAAPSWKWDGSNPEGVGMSPPPGLVEPRRGFGWLWRTHLDGPAGPLGWALDREYGFENIGQVQPFEAGLIFKGSAPRIYVLLEDGRFFAE